MSAAGLPIMGTSTVKSVYYQNESITWPLLLGWMLWTGFTEIRPTSQKLLHGGYCRCPHSMESRITPSLNFTMSCDPVGGITNVVRDDGSGRRNELWCLGTLAPNPMGWEPLSQAKMSLTGEVLHLPPSLRTWILRTWATPVANLVPLECPAARPMDRDVSYRRPIRWIPRLLTRTQPLFYCMNSRSLCGWKQGNSSGLSWGYRFNRRYGNVAMH